MENRDSRSYESQKLIMRLFFRGLLGYFVLDVVVFVMFDVAIPYAWTLLLAAEAIALVVGIMQNGQLIRRVTTPLAALEETADVLGRSDLDISDLRRLVDDLDEINAAHLSDRLEIPGGQQELAVLAGAINSMLERIETSYGAQARFVSDASHELRTPISVIQGYANMLDRWGKNDPAACQEGIDAIRQEAESMSSLVQNLLFLARGDNDTQQVNRVLVSLSDIASDVLFETTTLLEDELGQEVTGSVEPSISTEADPVLIKQAMRILVDNAIKYTPADGEIFIRLERRGRACVFSVTDTGQGIAEGDLPHIFERFYRTDESRNRQSGGTGLGLPIARWIVQHHGGSIEVLSRAGVGSRFSLVLPALELERE